MPKGMTAMAELLRFSQKFHFIYERRLRI